MTFEQMADSAEPGPVKWSFGHVSWGHT